jgi:DNA repair protein RadC
MVKDFNKGHRLRLKNKFLKTTPMAFHSYELLELLLFYSIPRVDVKPLAKLLINHFGSLSKVLTASPYELSKIPGIGQNTIIFFKLIKEAAVLSTKEQIINQPILGSWEKLISYLRANIGYNSVESMKVLYLNSKNILLGEELYDCGTTNKISIYPREIVKAALHYNATAIILVHNHPSGVSKPSQSDIDATVAIKNALINLDIVVIDHVIVSPNNEFSFQANALL